MDMVNPYTRNQLVKKPAPHSEPIDNVSIKIIPKERKNKETASCFDTTGLQTKKRPGDLTKKYTTFKKDDDGFAEHMTTKKPDPRHWLSKGTGTGGLAGTQAKEIILETNGPMLIKKPHPPPAGARAARINPPNTDFRRFYERGDLPVYLQGTGKASLKWKVNDIKLLDYHHYLPLFFDGLREIEHPYSTIAELGTIDLLEKGGAKRVLPVIPQLIIPIKNALNSRDALVIVKTLRILRILIEVDQPIPGEDNEERTGLIGLSLVPYYRQILPILNIFYSKNINIGDQIDYHQQKHDNIGDLIQDTLELLEQTGGEDAFINIKYLVPTYQSVLIN